MKRPWLPLCVSSTFFGRLDLRSTRRARLRDLVAVVGQQLLSLVIAVVRGGCAPDGFTTALSSASCDSASFTIR